MTDWSRIRVKAFAVILSADGSAHAVSRMSTTEDPVFHRPLGGSIEFGEHSSEAVVREIREELEATLVDISLLGVIENRFVIEGEQGHEIVFVYAGTLAEPDVVPTEGRVFYDLDVKCWVEWRPVAGVPDVPLFPDGLQQLINDHLGGRRRGREDADELTALAKRAIESAGQPSGDGIFLEASERVISNRD